ncbi:MAG: hypothetical protein PHS49_01590 [Candidatus Gracilibacteria bacterium]|nr:hypothetical protein [Candidatus Gracilibacteria bacterium]
MAINGNNNVNHNNNVGGGNNVDVKNRFIKDFVVESLKHDQSNEFINTVMNTTAISLDIKNQLSLFSKGTVADKMAYGNDLKSKYQGLDIDSITILDLKKEFSSIYASLKNKQENLYNLILNSYDLDNKNKNKLYNEIELLSDIKLKEFINSEKARNKFAKDIVGENINEKLKDIFKEFFPLSKLNIEKLNLLTKDEQNQIKSTFLEFENGKLTDSGLRILTQFDFLNESQIKEIVKNLIPTISLKQAFDNSLLNQQDLKKIKIELLKKHFVDLDLNDTNLLDDLVSKMKDDDLYISTEGFLNNNDNILKLSQGVGFYNVENEFREYVQDMEKSEEEKGPKDFKSFKNKLKEYKNVEGLDDLDKGSILKFVIVGKNGSYVEDYLRIDDFNDDEKIVNCSQVGKKNSKDDKTNINLSGTNKIDKKYSEYLSLLNNKNRNANISLYILSKNTFDDTITNKDVFEIDKDNLNLLNLDDIGNDIELQNKIINNLNINYDEQIELLENEITDLNIEKQSLKDSDDDVKKTRLDLLNILLKQKEEKLNSIRGFKDNLLSGNLNDDEKIKLLKEQNNFNELLEQIDSINPEGAKLGLSKGIILESNDGIYEIVGIDLENETIDINSIKGLEPHISYEAFFQSFKSKKIKRSKKVNNFDELLQLNSWDKDFKINDGILIEKDVELNGKKENREVEYFVSEDGELIKIESIGNNEVEVIFGEYSEGKKDRSTGSVKNKISLDSSSVRLSYSHLNKLIKDKKITPDSKIGKNYSITGKTDGYNNNIKGDFFTRYFNRLSFKEVFMAGKMTVDGILEYLKKGNDLKSAELAMKIGGIIGGDFAEDFIAQLELKQGEAMDKELTALGKISSGKAFERVKKWILNKNTPEYKKEAGLMLAAKYGMLYPKNLSEFNGTFLWYETLGGKIGDTLYEEEKERAKKSGQPFDEKELIISLLTQQSARRLKPYRRSKFNKEFKGKIAGGYGDERDTGYKDATDKRNIDDMITGGLDEVKNGVIPNALGWAVRAVEKGGDLKQMNTIYFSLIHSGGLYNGSTKILEELKGHWSGEGNGMILPVFGSSLSGQKLFNKTVRDISIDIEKAEPNKYKGIAKKAISLYEDAENGNRNYKERVENSINFWEKYGDVLSRTLFMADGKKDETDGYLKTDKIIELGSNSKYKDYFDYVKGWTVQPTSFKRDFMEDEVGPSGVTGLDTYEIVKKFYKLDNSRTFRQEMKATIELTWPKIWGDVNITKSRIESDPDNKEYYKKYLNKKLREISAGLLYGAGKDIYTTLDIIDPCGLDLKSIGITLSHLKDFRNSEILDGSKGKEIFDKAVENVLSGTKLESNKLGDISIFLEAEDTIDNTKASTYGIIGDDFE